MVAVPMLTLSQELPAKKLLQRQHYRHYHHHYHHYQQAHTHCDRYITLFVLPIQ